MKKGLFIFIAFASYVWCWYYNYPVRWVRDWLPDFRSVFYLVSFLLAGLIPCAALFVLHKKKDILGSLGLSGGFRTGLGMAVCATLPMFIGNACIGHWSGELTLDQFMYGVLLAGFFEEFFFRGFGFGQLFRYGKVGFIPAVLLTALPFGMLHLYQGHDLISSLSSFGVTALGGAFFCWLYVEWNYNLWCSIWMHILMNASWMLFAVSDNGAAGGLVTNLLRLLTIVVAVLLTVWYKKRNHLAYQVTYKTLWVKQS